MQNIIITGGAGFIGWNLANKFLKNNYKVIIIDVKKKYFNPISNKIKFIKCDITNEKKLNKICIKGKNNVLLHCAGQASAALSFKDPNFDLDLNIKGTLNIVKWSSLNNVTRIVYASTFNVYEEEKSKITEDIKTKPKSLYAISKFAGEEYIRVYANYLNIKWNIFRMFNVFGPGQDPNNENLGMVSIFLNMAKKNQDIIVKGSLDRFRDFIYIDDVSEAWFKLIKTKKYDQIFNLGSGKKTTLKTLLKIIKNITNNKKKVISTGGTPGDFFGCYSDINKIQKELKFYPKTNLHIDIKKFNKWINANKKKKF